MRGGGSFLVRLCVWKTVCVCVCVCLCVRVGHKNEVTADNM